MRNDHLLAHFFSHNTPYYTGISCIQNFCMQTKTRPPQKEVGIDLFKRKIK